MPIPHPYYRIVRPKVSHEYVLDERYASDRIQLSRAYLNIEKSLRNIFDYIEPAEENLKTYSFELYSLLLRACTEVEVNFKAILSANGIDVKRSSMKDYQKIEESSKLSEYTIILPNWRMDSKPVEKRLTPFIIFTSKKTCNWYSEYNQVKHNRECNFKYANLGNCINAVAAILVLLYSQFGRYCLTTYGISNLDCGDEDTYDGSLDANTIFKIIPPNCWEHDEVYRFDWEKIKLEESPFQKYDYKHPNQKEGN